MRTATRYIASLYAWNVITLLTLIFGLIVVVDVFINLDEFSDAANAITAEDDDSGVHHVLLTAMLVIDLWWPRALQLFNYLIGVVLVGAMGFSCWQLVRNRELIALLASGVSLQRVARPFLIVGLVFIAIAAVNQEVLIPRVAHLLNRDARDSGQRTPVAFPIPLTPDGQGRLFYAFQYDETREQMLEARVWIPDADGRLTSSVSADRARWDGDAWVFENLAPDETNATPTTVARIDSALDPLALRVRHVRGFGENLSWRQISDMIDAGGMPPEDRRRLDRTRWGRIAALASNFVTLAVALPFFLLRTPQPMLKAALKAAPVCLAGLAAAAAGATNILPGLPPAIAAFVPTFILIPFAIAFMSGVRT